jgi:hypothetical protein
MCSSCYRRHTLPLRERKADCHPDRPHYAKGKCRNCWRDSRRDAEPYHKRQQTWRRASLKRSFGITPEQHDAMRASQGDRCAMCRRDFGTKIADRPHVDHCHATGKVRGLLCFRCNTALGFIERWGEMAARYLAG